MYVSPLNKLFKAWVFFGKRNGNCLSLKTFFLLNSCGQRRHLSPVSFFIQLHFVFIAVKNVPVEVGKSNTIS